jgi:hypothetical protein
MGLWGALRLRTMETVHQTINQTGAQRGTARMHQRNPYEEAHMRYSKTSVSLVLVRGARSESACGRSARAIGRSLIAFLLSLPSARADVVADWTKIALHTVISSEQSQLRGAREMATVHIAMFETMNFIEGTYVPRFVVKPARPLSISSEAAAAAAAHHILVRLHPGQEHALDAALRYSLVSIPDAQERSGALITGKALGANIYGILAPGLSAAGGDSSGSTPKTSRVHAVTRASGATAVAWYWMAAQNAEAQRLRPIESARLYALVSMALSDVYGANRDVALFRESEHACVSCAAGAAVEVILESGLGAADSSGMTLPDAGATGAAYVASRMREYGRGLSSELPGQSSIEAGEKAGRTIGLRTLANYERSP